MAHLSHHCYTTEAEPTSIEMEFFNVIDYRWSRVLLNSYEDVCKGVYTSEKPLPTVESSLPADKLLHFCLAKNRKEINPTKADKFTRASIRGDINDILWQKVPMSIDEVSVLPDHSQPKLVLMEGAPGVGKSTFSWDFCIDFCTRDYCRRNPLSSWNLANVDYPCRENRDMLSPTTPL